MNALAWQRAVAKAYESGEAFVLVTVLETRGSAPRGDDSKMVVTERETFDSIGGGQLEYRVIAAARRMLDGGRGGKAMEEFVLGPDLDQCCGGRVKVLLEHFPAPAIHVELHGAGHVGRALVMILGGIDCRVRWIDERAGIFPEGLPGNVTAVSTRAAAAEVQEAPAGAWHLVMTHSHPLDLEICEAVLTRGDAAYLGLIGSRSKGARFRRRLAERGFSDDELAVLECPIGLPSMGGKAPMEIAVSVVADILGRAARRRVETTPLSVVRR